MDKSEFGKLAYEAYWQHEPPPVHIAWESLSEQEHQRWITSATTVLGVRFEVSIHEANELLRRPFNHK